MWVRGGGRNTTSGMGLCQLSDVTGHPVNPETLPEILFKVPSKV